MAAVTASIHDLLNTLFWPVIIVVLAWMRKLHSQRHL
jgi:hypothetical protein